MLAHRFGEGKQGTMVKWIPLALVTFFISVWSIEARQIRFKTYYEGLPDLEQEEVFAAGQTAKIAESLHALLSQERQSNSSRQGAVSSASKLEGPAVAEARNLVGAMVTGLVPERFTQFWLVDLIGDREPELLVQYDHEVPADGDRYAAFFSFQWNGTKYIVATASWFLEGSLHAVREFGPSGASTVFVEYWSCTECHAWVYLAACDFFVTPGGAAYEFSYNVDAPDSWRRRIEYELPGRGHSIEAEVETRLPKQPTLEGPHLLQYFDVEVGDDEWWSSVCDGKKCRSEMFTDPPRSFQENWNASRPL